MRFVSEHHGALTGLLDLREGLDGLLAYFEYGHDGGYQPIAGFCDAGHGFLLTIENHGSARLA